MTTDNKTLADAQPGGRARLGDQLPPLPHPNYPVSKTGLQNNAYTASQMLDYARAAISAQPSPGGQGDGVSISDDDRAVLQRLQDALPTAGINGWAKGVDVLERLLRESLAARHPVETQLGYTLSDVHEAYSRGKRDAARQPVGEPVEMSPEFTDTARAAIAWVLWHHQGGSSPVGQPLRVALGMGQHDRLTDHQVSEAKRFAAFAGATTGGFHHHKAAQAVDLGQFRQPVQDWLDDAQASMEEHGDYDGVFGHAIEEGTRLLALIDSQAVGNK